MNAGYSGTFVISWAQTELDGLRGAPTEALMIGSQWRWTGDVTRIDGPNEVLVLLDREKMEDRRRRAARMVRRLLGSAVTGRDLATLPDQGDVPHQSFVLTDGTGSWTATLVEVAESAARLIVFAGAMPPRDTDLWVINTVFEAPRPADRDQASGVICFTPGTRIAVPGGERPIEDIRPGDHVETRDNGPQQVLWTGRRRMTGARLYAMPHLRPIRVRAGAIGGGRPDGDLIVSPGHRMLFTGRAAAALFSAPEVLIAARDLVGAPGISVEAGLPEVTYIHLLTERHEVIRANGVDTESFHPASAAFDLIEPNQRAALLAIMPELETDPTAYGAYARRSLTSSETAILLHDAAA